MVFISHGTKFDATSVFSFYIIYKYYVIYNISVNFLNKLFFIGKKHSYTNYSLKIYLIFWWKYIDMGKDDPKCSILKNI